MIEAGTLPGLPLGNCRLAQAGARPLVQYVTRCADRTIREQQC